ncbi:MAG: hypothetical protein K6U04_13320 [Armatimonadetes bacterium]|nr:hypothetical protein [Armatimonadota bacterium]
MGRPGACADQQAFLKGMGVCAKCPPGTRALSRVAPGVGGGFYHFLWELLIGLAVPPLASQKKPADYGGPAAILQALEGCLLFRGQHF